MLVMSRPTYEPGDYIKVDFPDSATGVGEWMWVRVSQCDDDAQVVFGHLDSEPIGDYHGKIRVGAELAIRYTQVREHKKFLAFRDS